MVLVLPARHVEADFADHGLGDANIDPIDPREVDTADAMEFTAQIELRGMAARLPAPLGTGAQRIARGRGRVLACGCRVSDLVGEAAQVAFERLIASTEKKFDVTRRPVTCSGGPSTVRFATVALVAAIPVNEWFNRVQYV
jgi:hypothetical protein